MHPNLINKLNIMQERYQTLDHLLSDPNIIADPAKLKQYGQEQAALEPLVHSYKQYCSIEQEITGCQELLQDPDPSMHAAAREEMQLLTSQLDAAQAQLLILLIPKDPNDDSNIFIEIRAGTGGDEAGIFVGDLFRMYQRYAESKRWQVSVISSHVSAQGGFKEIIAQIQGNAVFASLKFEAGVHRVQRIPTTESQGRIHTSACTVAVLPELQAIEAGTINPSEIRVDTFRASGAGGQHVNTTDSAVRITHLPTGIVAECQDERSQHKNKAKAMSLLSTKILDQQRRAQEKDHSEKRKNMVGSGDRSERIRTYNFPQGRITDHRINQTWYQLDEMIAGDIEPMITALKQAQQAEQLTALKESH